MSSPPTTSTSPAKTQGAAHSYGSTSRADAEPAGAEPPVKVVSARRSRHKEAQEPAGIQDADWWKPAADAAQTNERAPLLDPPPEEPPQTAGQVVRAEVIILAEYAIPAFITNFLEYSLLMAPIISIGHLSTTALAAGTLASMTASVTGLTMAHAFASALDTMLPPAWTSGKPSLVGLWTQRMLFVMALLNIPCIAVWLNAEAILLQLRQEPDVARLAAQYLRYLSIGLPAFSFNAVLRRYFQCQGLFNIPTRIILVVAPINALMDYLLVWGPDWLRLGFVGGPLATAISFNLVFLMSLYYVFTSSQREAWHPFTSDSFKQLGILVYLGLAGVGEHIATEWWAWEVVNLAASRIGKTSLAAQSVLLVSCTTTFQAPYSIASAASVRVGNLLGEHNSHKAQLVSRLAFAMAMFVALGWCAMFLLLRNKWAYIFNDDPDVVKIVARLLPLVGFIELLDGVTTVGSGILRAAGRQAAAAIVVIVAYYFAGIPLGLYLTFRKNMGLLGLWAGLSLSLLMVMAFVVTLVSTLDWEVEAEKARERLRGRRGRPEASPPAEETA
ncbi:MATE efflux family protein [Exidia glandulosa HHB12029]|uniref:MATE efflux family protein n=1 Tax=Exidia glandulosa HHB12029 TaxID=1314781 RepID=A0A165KU47_EXIGL|nr:MATE efflux family protein [Exidia glandulosa HHB12029]